MTRVLELHRLSACLAGQCAGGCHLAGFVRKGFLCLLTQGAQGIAGEFHHVRDGRKRACTQSGRVEPLFCFFTQLLSVRYGLIQVAGKVFLQFFALFCAEFPERGHLLMGNIQRFGHRFAPAGLSSQVEFVEFAGQLVVLLRQSGLVLIVVFHGNSPENAA